MQVDNAKMKISAQVFDSRILFFVSDGSHREEDPNYEAGLDQTRLLFEDLPRISEPHWHSVQL
jgi:hypothetical protein